MRFRHCLVAVWIIACASVTVRADFTFIHASDIHIGADNNHETDAALFAEITRLTPRPAFVVVTGDICEYGTDEQYALYRETIKHLGDVKIFPAPGNHDVRWNPRGKEGYTKGTGAPLFQSWDHENIHFITLDSNVLLEHWGHIAQEELNWLKQDLEKVGKEKPVIIGFHHWIGRQTVQVDNEQALMDLIKPYNVVLWLQGHGHSDIEWNVNGTPAIMVAGLYQGSYNIVQVTNDELKISKRLIPKPGRNSELVRDKSAPDEKVEPTTRPVMTIPLKKRPAPQWSADAKLEGGNIIISARPPEGATLEYRINTDKPQPLTNNLATVPTTQISPGEHVVTVQATLPDTRAYQIPIMVDLPGIEPLWRTNIGGEVQSRLVKTNDTIFVSSMGNDLIALNPAEGMEKFRVKTGGPIFSACDVEGDTAYFGSADHFVYAFNAADGKPKWKTETGGAVLAGPNVAQGVVCVGSTDTIIYGLDAATGAILWKVQGKNMFQSKTATDGTHFFVGGWDNFFRCIDARSGKELWSIELGKKQPSENFSAFAPAITAPAVGNGKVYVSTNDGILHALRIEDKSEAWQIDWKKMGYSSPLFHDGKVYGALSDEGKVFCVDAETGEFKWTTETGAVIYDSSFCFGGDAGNGNVFIANVNGTLNAIKAADGKIEWQYRMSPGHLLGSPVADKKRVYMGSMNGNVIALPIHVAPAATAK